uniref:Uncharacterized protein n=1 Tax=viral metagenome TaxID=1070528 RepID=A0A6C0JK22_9ZZZZ
MDAYTVQTETNALKGAQIYKVTTTKSTFLGRYQGRNKKEQLHFIDTTTNRLMVLDPADHIVSVHSAPQ